MTLVTSFRFTFSTSRFFLSVSSFPLFFFFSFPFFFLILLFFSLSLRGSRRCYAMKCRDEKVNLKRRWTCVYIYRYSDTDGIRITFAPPAWRAKCRFGSGEIKLPSTRITSLVCCVSTTRRSGGVWKIEDEHVCEHFFLLLSRGIILKEQRNTFFLCYISKRNLMSTIKSYLFLSYAY